MLGSACLTPILEVAMSTCTTALGMQPAWALRTSMHTVEFDCCRLDPAVRAVQTSTVSSKSHESDMVTATLASPIYIMIQCRADFQQCLHLLSDGRIEILRVALSLYHLSLERVVSHAICPGESISISKLNIHSY